MEPIAFTKHSKKHFDKPNLFNLIWIFLLGIVLSFAFSGVVNASFEVNIDDYNYAWIVYIYCLFIINGLLFATLHYIYIHNRSFSVYNMTISIINNTFTSEMIKIIDIDYINACQVTIKNKLFYYLWIKMKKGKVYYMGIKDTADVPIIISRLETLGVNINNKLDADFSLKTSNDDFLSDEYSYALKKITIFSFLSEPWVIISGFVISLTMVIINIPILKTNWIETDNFPSVLFFSFLVLIFFIILFIANFRSNYLIKLIKQNDLLKIKKIALNNRLFINNRAIFMVAQYLDPTLFYLLVNRISTDTDRIAELIQYAKMKYSKSTSERLAALLKQKYSKNEIKDALEQRQKVILNIFIWSAIYSVIFTVICIILFYIINKLTS
jgi:hypothetical protein